MKKIPKALIDTILQDGTILFIGSGVSLWSGAPSWQMLLDDLLEFIDYKGLCSESEKQEISEHINNNDLLVAASLARLLIGKTGFNEFINKEFIEEGFKTHEIHDIITTLGPNCFITTNYDHLIEDAYKKNHEGLFLSKVLNNQPTEQVKILKHSSNKFIFKPHGDITHTDDIVLANEDYRSIRSSKDTIETLKQLLIQRPVLYIGFGLSDPTFQLITDFIADTYREAMRQHFAIMPNVSELKRRLWQKDYGVTILSYDVLSKVEIIENEEVTFEDHSNLINLLKELKTKVSHKRKEVDEGNNNIASEEAKLDIVRFCHSISFNYRKENDIYIDIYGKKIDAKEEWNYRHEFEKHEKISTVLESSENLIILGGPGIGKTTSLRNFVYNKSEAVLQPDLDIEKHAIPMMISFKEYDGNIENLIKDKLPKKLRLESTLKKGLFTFIFDAVNEAPKEYFETKSIEEDLKGFINKYSNNRFILSSRTRGYLSFLNFDRFELIGLSSKTINNSIKQKFGDVDLPYQIYKVLKNPFFFSLFEASNIRDIDELNNPIKFIDSYFENLHRDMETDFDISIIETFSKVAFEITELGKQVNSLEYFKNHLSLPSEIDKDEFINYLISNEFLIPDSDGNVGFFHQTILEYLSAKELLNKDYSYISEILNNSRWDETIILFANLLEGDRLEKLMRRIIDKDIFYALNIYRSASFESQKIADQIFEGIIERIEEDENQEAKLNKIAWRLRYLEPSEKHIKRLKELLKDDLFGPPVALMLAKLNCTNVIPDIIKSLLERSNSYPSDYVEAMKVFDERDKIDLIFEDEMLQNIDPEEEGLQLHNLSDLFSHFWDSDLRNKVFELYKSENKRDKKIALSLLNNVDKTDFKESYIQLVEHEKDEELLAAIFYSVRGSFISSEIIPPLVDDRLINIAFDYLNNKNIGGICAGYLERINDKKVNSRAEEKLKASNLDPIAEINLCYVISSYNNDLAKKHLLKYFHNFNPEYSEILKYAVQFSKVGIKHDLLSLMKDKNNDLNRLIIKLYHHDSEDVSSTISKETCLYLLNIWEEAISKSETIKEEEAFYDRYVIPNFLGNACKKHVFDQVIKNMNSTNYANRDNLIYIAQHLNLKLSNFEPEILDWLLQKMIKEDGHFKPATKIIANIANEKFFEKNLKPLLNSESPVTKDNVYTVVSDIESRINKRLIKH